MHEASFLLVHEVLVPPGRESDYIIFRHPNEACYAFMFIKLFLSSGTSFALVILF